MDRRRIVLYDIDWQVFRCTMLAGHNTYGGWETDHGCLYNVGACASYLRTENNKPEAVMRVINLCNAVLLGYGNREGLDDQRAYVRKLRDSLKQESFTLPVPELWWAEQREAFKRWSRHELTMVLDNLRKRQKTSQYKARKRGETDNADGYKHRTELATFTIILEEYLNGSK